MITTLTRDAIRQLKSTASTKQTLPQTRLWSSTKKQSAKSKHQHAGSNPGFTFCLPKNPILKNQISLNAASIHFSIFDFFVFDRPIIYIFQNSIFLYWFTNFLNFEKPAKSALTAQKIPILKNNDRKQNIFQNQYFLLTKTKKEQFWKTAKKSKYHFSKFWLFAIHSEKNPILKNHLQKYSILKNMQNCTLNTKNSNFEKSRIKSAQFFKIIIFCIYSPAKSYFSKFKFIKYKSYNLITILYLVDNFSFFKIQNYWK